MELYYIECLNKNCNNKETRINSHPKARCLKCGCDRLKVKLGDKTVRNDE